ncbi:MAG: protein kinase [Deltaproteobacteria bacterium]|nr:protein kinase [Deltaproteobacteria bacterium]
MNCPQCQGEVFDIDVKCGHCGAALGATGAQRMIGQTVLGMYELSDVLGQGGMSVVFKAKHKMTDQEVALKILPPELAAHSQVKSRFLEEAKALAALDHPNIVHLYNFGQENGSFVLAMQYVQGKTWERVILESKRLDWKQSCRIAIDVLKALEYAHGRGIVHRDMKPSNVLVRLDGMATVMDFGIAKMAQSTRLTATGQTMGTVRYMSPEQVRGQDVDLRTDIYSLGATLYESLVGETPFDGQTHFEIMTKHLSEAPKAPSALGVEVPYAVEEAILKSLAKKAENRFESARDMRKELEVALKENDVALHETQRVSRDAITIPPKRPQTTPRPATASDLADQLEPRDETPPPVAKRSMMPVIAIAMLVLAGGAIAAFFVLGKKPGYQAVTRVKGADLKAGKTINGMLVETDGALTPEEVAAAYTKELGELETRADKLKAHWAVIDVVVALPQRLLCEPSAYPVDLPPSDCKSLQAAHAIGAGGKHVLYVADDKAGLDGALRQGIADAVCKLQVAYDDDPKHIDEICAVTTKFAAGQFDIPAKPHE